MFNKYFSLVILTLIILLVLPALVLAGDCAYYFYGSGCAECDVSNTQIQELEKSHPEMTIKKYEVYFHPDNAQLLQDHFAAYKVPEKSQGIPALFLSNSYLIGDSAIGSLAENSLTESVDGCPTLTPADYLGVTGKCMPFNIVKALSFFKVTASALTDALRPGLLALVLILTLCLINLRDNKKIVEVGVRFIIGVYMIYFLFSVGLFSWFASLSWDHFIYKTIGAFSIFYGLIVLKNFFIHWKIIKFSEKKQKFFSGLRKVSLSIYGIFFISSIATLFSLTNVSNVLLSLRYAFRTSSGWLALPVTLYYLLIMVLPLIAVLVFFMLLRKKYPHQVVDKIINKVQNINSENTYHFNLSKIIAGVFCVALGFVLLLW